MNEFAEELKKLNHWICWKAVPDKNRPGKFTKIPVNPHTGGNAQSNNPATWSDYETALAASVRFDGIGIMFVNDLCGIDIDNCIVEGKLSDLAAGIIEEMQSYTELSPSGTGIHILFNGSFPDDEKLYYKNNRDIGLEMYQDRRFFTFTGQAYRTYPLKECSKEATAILYKHMCKPQAGKTAQSVNPAGALLTMPHEVIEKASNAKNGQIFEKLFQGEIAGYSSQSEADLALCNILAFWCGRDKELMDSVFRMSALMRDKWERDDYREDTLNKAINDCTQVYCPDNDGYKIEFAQDSNNLISVMPPDFTDTGNAEVFCKVFKGKAIFVRALGWLVWNGKKWETNDLKAVRLAKRLTGEMLKEARTIIVEAEKNITLEKVKEMPDEDSLKKAQKEASQAKAYLKHAMETRNAPKIKNMLELAKPELHIELEQLDADPFILNTPGGIVDLKTGAISPHDPKKLCSCITRATPAKGESKIWDDFLNTISVNDIDIANYLKQGAGMAAIGRVYEEVLTMAFGDGSNGKSSHYNTLAYLLGDYAGYIPAETLTTDRQNRGAVLAELKGKRLIIAAELEEGKRLSTGVVKQLTSTDRIAAERKYKDPEYFTPTHSTVLYTNHKPKVGSLDNGTWRRIVLVPFNAKIQGKSDIKNYSEYLVQNCGEAIMQWIVEGAAMFYNNNFKLDAPEEVKAATEAYKEANDWLSRFIDERCELGIGKTEKAGGLLFAYRAWAEGSGEYVRQDGDFTAEMERRGYEKSKNKHGAFWYGLTLKSLNAFAQQSSNI